MKHSLFRGLTVCLAVASLSSCQDYDGDFTPQQIKEAAYARNFVNTFGEIDPNQDWDLFGQLAKSGGASRALTRGASNIVVTDLGENYYKNVSSEMNQQYQKMLPESEGSTRPYSETNLGRVTQNFSAYATELTLYPIHWNTSGADEIGIYYYSNSSDSEATAVTGTDGVTYYIVKKKIYANKTHVDGVKETTAYSYVTLCTDAHWAELVAANPSKYFISDGTQKHQYGGAIPSGTKIIKSGVQKETYYGSGVFFDVYYRWNLDVDVTDLAEDLMKLYSTYVVADGTATYKDAYGNTIEKGSLVELKTTYGYGSVASYQDLSSAFNDYTYLRSKPIKVTIPAGVGKIGFWIQNGTPISYSESKLNAKVSFSDEGQKEACYVATYIDTDASGQQIVEDGKPVRYLCFEDWMSGATNFDLNDVVFRVYGLDEGGSKIVDEDEYDETAILVCEDLGDFDYDYNDVVLKLNYREHETKTYTRDAQGNVTNVTSSGVDKSFSITAMAAGGANESDVYYGSTKWGEIHTLLNGSAPTIINAGAEMGSEGQTVTLTGTNVPDYSRSNGNVLSQVFSDGYISIKTHSNGSNTNSDVAILLTSSDKYKTKGAPMMILLPADYLWCQETKGIEEVYPRFTSWVSDATLTNWLSSRSTGTQEFTQRNVPEETTAAL